MIQMSMIIALGLALTLVPLTPAPVAAQGPAPAQVVLPTDRTVLPIPEPQYPHSTVFDVRNTTPPPRFEVKAPAKAPNVLIVLIDDMGFGQSSAFGGPIHMPTVERLAQGGLRYNHFHTTALCSPTRAALLSGRNQHMNNFGSIAETATAFPGQTGQRPNSVAPLAYNWLGLQRYTVAATQALPAGKATIRFEFAYDGGGVGKGGTGTLFVNGKKVASARIDRTQCCIFSADEGADVGADEGTPVIEGYKVPFKFTGKIGKVTIELKDVKTADHNEAEQTRNVATLKRALAD